MTDDRLIVALDYSSMDQVEKIVAELGDNVSYYKVGMELFYSVGSKVIAFLKEKNKNIFLDLKLHDIPNTVAKSAAALTRLGVTMLNVHASGGENMMRAAVDAVAEQAQVMNIPRPKLIAVTVLTSIGAKEWSVLNPGKTIAGQVTSLADIAQSVGIDGVVASPNEASVIREKCGKNFLIVTPGIRPYESSADDQNRIATPQKALLAGASHLVVGRPITQAPNPHAVVQNILQEMGAIK